MLIVMLIVVMTVMIAVIETVMMMIMLTEEMVVMVKVELSVAMTLIAITTTTEMFEVIPTHMVTLTECGSGLTVTVVLIGVVIVISSLEVVIQTGDDKSNAHADSDHNNG